MSVQQQDLTVYRDNSITHISKKSLDLITYVEGTAPTWLIAGLVEDYLLKTCTLINTSSPITDKARLTRDNVSSRVILFTFIRDSAPFEKFFKKIGLTQGKDFKIVEMLNVIHEGEDHVLKRMQDELINFEDPNKPLTIFLDSPELLLHSTSMEVNKYLSFLQSLHRRCTKIVLVTAIDDPLIDIHSTTRHSVEFRHTEFITKLMHKSSLIFTLKPLETGRADDVTGSLTINRGMVDDMDVLEKEYLFLVNKEGVVKLFFR